MEVLRKKLESCLRILNRGVEATSVRNMNWLNDFCAALLEFSSAVHESLSDRKQSAKAQESAELVCLCLTQIMVCVRQVECTMKLASGSAVSASHVYFLDRIRWCLQRLLHLCSSDESTDDGQGRSFLKLLDSTLDTLALFSSSNEENSDLMNFPNTPAEILSLGAQLRVNIDLLLGQTLGFANVALQQDKRALSALCQKVIRELSAFQDECKDPNTSSSNLKLKSMTLEQALYQLEDFINDALLRLVFTCFLDFQKFSVDKIRTLLRSSSADESIADEFIADFDVNIDRATQIGIFAIAFAPNLKMKTMMRSCLASFESLDTSLIPSLQANGSDLYSDVLEQHFDEEVAKFKAALQEIIESRAFLGCCLEILTAGISAAEKHYEKGALEDLLQMALFVLEHFQVEVNRKVLAETKLEVGQEYLQQLIRILRECKAILMCASQVEQKRIIKRFKILRTILRKLHGCIGASSQREEGPSVMDSHLVDESQEEPSFSGIATSHCSILYDTVRRRRLARPTDAKPKESKQQNIKTVNYSVRRRESLRTVMFKRQNMAESKRMYTTISNQSANLQITDILEQLTGMSTGAFEC
ncbi:LOW QUALITY PROTEIN: serendipity locus protein alpha [Drosophila subobscura]|uniref:LOW QUALITY PROTEIN: serendipity locus protein alpha n=1 Tax=Drosophila subobscura TaxID=7241 RepID=UPI00155A0976|nr:LOW QUALITY PROTEIN: serendipity locus protein alpha [Drosophila subobscura]